ncbi:hypothetical protein ACMBCN_00985 [Candidatus Liberibacter asiaticus]|nr:hypothetical protein [Candidatus Liberibacter asiaticus]
MEFELLLAPPLLLILPQSLLIRALLDVVMMIHDPLLNSQVHPHKHFLLKM